MFTVIITTAGAWAASLTAIGLFLAGLWRLHRAWTKSYDKNSKILASVGEINGDGKTIAQNVKDLKVVARDINQKMDETTLWRSRVDVILLEQNRTLAHQDITLAEHSKALSDQGAVVKAIDVAVEQMLKEE